jgi:hypothetical protein
MCLRLQVSILLVSVWSFLLITCTLSCHFIANWSRSDVWNPCGSTWVFVVLLIKAPRLWFEVFCDDEHTHFCNKNIRLLGFMSYSLGLLETLLVYGHNCEMCCAHYQCLDLCWIWVLVLVTAVSIVLVSTYNMSIPTFLVLNVCLSYSYNGLQGSLHM